jgi:hypothetical protein
VNQRGRRGIRGSDQRDGPACVALISPHGIPDPLGLLKSLTDKGFNRACAQNVPNVRALSQLGGA